jgi:hypothetical protein
MALFSFYNTRKPRQFTHRPIYWDPKKEEMELRKQRIRRELGLEETPENYKPQIKGKIIEQSSHLRRSVINRGEDVRTRTYKNVRLIAICVFLIVLFWVLFIR